MCQKITAAASCIDKNRTVLRRPICQLIAMLKLTKLLINLLALVKLINLAVLVEQLASSNNSSHSRELLAIN